MFNLPAVGGGKKVFSNELWMSNPGTARFNSSIGTKNNDNQIGVSTRSATTRGYIHLQSNTLYNMGY